MLDPLSQLRELRVYQPRRYAVERIPSGSLQLDVMLDGGWVRRGINEIIGDPDTGKSLVTYLAIAASLERGEMAVLFDSEGTFDADWAGTFFDIRSSNFVLIQNFSAEYWFNMTGKLAYNQLAPLVILDSWSALAFASEVERDLTRDETPELNRMRGWGLSFFLRGLNITTGTLLFTSHRPQQIGHEPFIPAYLKYVDVRIGVRNDGKFITARTEAGKEVRRGQTTHVYRF